MQELFKPLEGGSLFGGTGDDGGAEGDWSGGDLSGGGRSNALAQYGAESLARALSERGGFGIAREILEQLEHRPAKGSASSRPGAALGAVEVPRVGRGPGKNSR